VNGIQDHPPQIDPTELAFAREEHQRLEESLRRAEERYRLTFEQAPVGITNTDRDGRFTSVNQRYCALVGYGSEELLGRPCADFTHPDDSAALLERYRDLLDGKLATARYDRRYVRKDGSVAWVNVALSPMLGRNGEIDFVIGLVEDVTAQKAASETLLRQAHLLECVEQAVIATDVAGRVTFWNAAAQKLHGWSAGEMTGTLGIDLVSPESRDEATAVGERLMRGESWKGELRLRHRDGHTFPACVIDAPLLDDEGAISGVVGVSYDLTEERRADDELREHKLQLAEAQEIARLGSWTHDFTTGRRQWSEELCRLVGVSRTPTVEELRELIHPSDRSRFVELEHTLLHGLEPCPPLFRIVNATGERTLSLSCRTVRDEQGEPLKLLGVVQDVTDMKSAEDELRRHAMLQSAVANLGQLALSGASVHFLLEQAAVSLRTVLAVDLSEILQKDESGFVLVAGDGWEAGEIGISKLGDAAQSQASYTVSAAVPVIVEDIAAEGRFAPSALLGEKGMVSGLTVAISSGDRTPWGVLGVHARRRRAFTAYEIDFLRSVATVLGQAIDRAASDAEVRSRARQQSVIADLGRLVLSSLDNDLLDHACELLRIGVGADYAFINDLTVGDTLRYRAGKFWYDALPREMPVSAGSQSGLTILSREPTLVDDYREEQRFRTYDETVPHGILSGLMVPITSATRTFGVLSVQSRVTRHFRPEDIDFLQAIANMLAEAMEREAGQAAVLDSEHRYRRIFDGASEIIFTIGRKGDFVALNPAFSAVTGWPCEEWLGRSFAELIVPAEMERLLGFFGGMTLDHSTIDFETTLLGREREVVLEVTSFPKVENGEVTEVYGFGRDVTEKRRAMRERERVARRLELLLESTVEGIYTIDLEGRCTMVNRSAAAFLGLMPHELLGERVHELLRPLKADGSPLPEDECTVHDVLRAGARCTIDNAVLRRKDGVLIPIAYSAAPIIDGDQLVGAVITFTDLTERHKLERKLEQANRLSSLGRLAATVAHEFNNVLMGIAPFVDVIRRAPGPVKVAASLDHIISSVKRGRRVTQDILRFTQPAEPVRTAVEVDAWLDSVAGEARSLLSAAYDVVLQAEPLTIDADAHQLRQIFTNLILNARDAMPRGGTIRIEARREPDDASFAFGCIENPGRYAHFLFSDTGCGISPETLNHIFEPLFTTKKSGIGLGLAVTHQVVQLHGGEIFVESTEGAGSTFHIFLPLSTGHSSPLPEPAGEVPHDRGLRRILVVEDDPIVAAGLTEMLEFGGFSVISVATGGEALAALHHGTPDAVVLDVGLPDMDGQTVYASIAATHPALPVIFSTGHADQGRLEELLARPNVKYLLKPYEADALMDALGGVLGGAASPSTCTDDRPVSMGRALRRAPRSTK
jgi:PAS domain S-box-containing protein